MFAECVARRRELGREVLNFDARTVAGAGTVTSDVFSVAGFYRATFFIFLDRAAATQLDITLDLSPETHPSTDTLWYPAVVETNSAGTVSAPTKTVRRAAIGADAYLIAHFDNIEGAYSARLNITDTGGTTDTLTVTAVLTA